MKNKWVLSSLLALSIPATGLMMSPKAYAAAVQDRAVVAAYLGTENA